MTATPLSRAVEKEFLALAHPKKAALSMRFFKTGKGEYAEGDIFLGLTVPDTRTIVKRHWQSITLPDVARLLESRYHEIRLGALKILVEKYRASDDAKLHKAIFTLYTKHTKYINNWDLVDTSAAQIVGHYLSCHMEHEERLAFIDKYCMSRDLWQNRIIVVATFYQIRLGNEKMLYYVARKLMQHKHDLIHKAIGWMLREVGKRDRKVLVTFLNEHKDVMPRTMLRYSIEHFPPAERRRFMTKGQ